MGCRSSKDRKSRTTRRLDEPKGTEARRIARPEGYWIDPDRDIRRLGDKDGEQVAVLRAAACFSDAEWDRFYKAIVAGLDSTPA
jgi:hypothetical protein